MREQREREQNRLEVEKRNKEALIAKADEDERRARDARKQYVVPVWCFFLAFF